MGSLLEGLGMFASVSGSFLGDLVIAFLAIVTAFVITTPTSGVDCVAVHLRALAAFPRNVVGHFE
jgi:hypothetical protein